MNSADNKPVVGLDLGGTKILAAVVSPDGRILSRAKKKTKANKGAEAVLERISKVIQSAIEEAGLQSTDLAGIGAGSPGPLDPDTGIIVTAPNLGWENVNLKKYLEEIFGIPAFIDNDVNVGTLGELRLGAGKGISSAVGIFVGTGIGGGIILDGKLYRGFNKTAGEIGHMVLDPSGPVCGCGQKGCLEALASRTAISRMIEESLADGKKSIITKVSKRDIPKLKSRDLAVAFQEGDKVVTSALRKSAHYVGLAIGSLINFLNPEMFILGGGVVEAVEAFYLNEVTQSATGYAFAHASKNVRIVAAQLGDDSGVIGASQLARDRLAKV
jgi:glucokinase